MPYQSSFPEVSATEKLKWLHPYNFSFLNLTSKISTLNNVCHYIRFYCRLTKYFACFHGVQDLQFTAVDENYSLKQLQMLGFVMLYFSILFPLANDLFRRDNLEGATSSRGRRLLVCCIVTFFNINVSSTTCFDLIRSPSSRQVYVITALYFFF